MDLAELTTKAKEALEGGVDGFTNKVKFDFGDAGKLLLDGTTGTASNDDGEADATLSLSWDNFMKMVQGNMDPTMAFMQGKLKVSGDMSVAMQLKELVSRFA